MNDAKRAAILLWATFNAITAIDTMHQYSQPHRDWHFPIGARYATALERDTRIGRAATSHEVGQFIFDATAFVAVFSCTPGQAVGEIAAGIGNITNQLPRPEGP